MITFRELKIRDIRFIGVIRGRKIENRTRALLAHSRARLCRFARRRTTFAYP